MRRPMKHWTTFLLSLCTLQLTAQMWNGQDTLYGNEWINYDQNYFKIKVAEDGIYRLGYEQLQDAGFPLDQVEGRQFQLFHLGREVPIYPSDNSTLSPGGFLEFYGSKNRSELDQFLYTAPEADLLNPEYSLFTDSSAYFLTWTTEGAPPLRYVNNSNDLSNLPPRENWYWATDKKIFSGQHHKRYQKYSGANIYYSHFDGDGFANEFQEETQIMLSAPGRVPGGPKANLSVNLISNANAEGHILQIDLNQQLLQQDTFYGTQVRKYEFELATADLEDELLLRVLGLNDVDRYGVASGSIRYPRNFNFNGESLLQLELPAANGERYLEINGLSPEPYVLLEPAGNLRMLLNVTGGTARIKLPAGSGPRYLVLQRLAAMQAPGQPKPLQFENQEESDANYLILSSERLYDDGLGNNWVQAYADYRASADGGNYRTAVIEVKQLFDQFAYGIDFHPLSIRNAFHFLRKQQMKDLEYVFIIGRGQEYQEMRLPQQLQEAIAGRDMLVPSFGYPAGDNLLFTTNETKVSPISNGRLAANDPAEIKIYLDKVKDLERSRQLPQTIADRAWTKHILHLGGGATAGEQTNIRSHLEAMAAEIEQNSFGGTVRAIYKSSADAIQNSVSQEIFEYINEGTAMITFFGHSAPGTFDFNIDNPDNYDNMGKYPLVLSLGCYSGNIFGSSRSISERFCFYEDKAAVVFGASRGLGFVSALATFAKDFYRNIGENYYGQSIGKALRATYLDNNTSAWVGTATLVEQFTLHGDPAIRLHPVEGPDYVIDAASVTFGPDLISSQIDSFNFSFDVVNLGRNEMDTVSLIVSRTFPDGSLRELLKDTVVVDRFRKTRSYRLAVGGSQSIGQNIFHVRIDADDQADEYPNPAAEMNNELMRSNGEPGITKFIIDNTARAVYPPEFALIGNPDISLKASTTNALAPERTYWLEVDTTARFDSPLKVRQTRQQRGGVLNWKPDFNWQDGTVYYWRISPAVSTENPEPVWSASSFTYVADSEPGWRQGHYWQFRENTETDLAFADTSQRVNFGLEYLDMRVRNKLWELEDRPGFHYNNDNPARSVRPWEYLAQGISVSVFEPNNGVGWRNTGRQFNSVDRRNQACFSYDTRTAEGRAALMTFLKEDVPPDHIVFLFTIQATPESDYLAETWAADSLTYGENLFSVLEAEGAQLIRDLDGADPVPYAFIYQKGKGARDEALATGIYEEINVTTILRSFFTQGQLSSKLIGPARSWRQLNWNIPESSLSVNDTTAIHLIGIRTDGSQDTLLRSIAPSQDLQDIDAAEYPYLKLHFTASDAVSRDPAFPDSWTVYYEGVPELAVNPALSNYEFRADTLQQGIDLALTATVENLSMFAADSIDLQFRLIDPQNQETIFRQRKAPLAGGEQLTFEFGQPTDDLQGSYALNTEVNPDRDPAEQHYFNNVLHQNFEVVSDRKNPLLDVTFDGRVLLNGDLVGAQPLIAIRLKDENPYLLLSDTSLISMRLSTPDGRTQEIPANSPEVQFVAAASGSKNELSIDYQPTFTQDGTYRLSVNGRDVSGNFSGAVDYEVEFEVRTRNSISNVLNYPNPFSTSTQFVYTLTGSAPTFFKIQIMTVSGRVVREITQHEIGSLQVGTHRTEFAWDGTDEFGDRLANGVYLYRIVAKDENGKDFESYDDYVGDTGLAGFFERGFGKMVLLR